MAMALALLVSSMGVAFGAVDATPSTNEINETNGWSHFDVLDRVLVVVVEFVNTAGLGFVLQYRSDGEGPDYSRDKYNTDIEAGSGNSSA